MQIQFCNHCGNKVDVRIPEGDSVPRHVCDTCGNIQYINPKVVVGCIPEWRDKILICKRAIEPRRGLWTLPAGFLEAHETLEAGAARETLEEAGARVAIGTLYTVFNLPEINQIYMIFRATLSAPEYGPGTESLEVKLVSEHEIPWPEIAFPTIRETLTHYYDDRKTGQFPLRVRTLRKRQETAA